MASVFPADKLQLPVDIENTFLSMPIKLASKSSADTIIPNVLSLMISEILPNPSTYHLCRIVNPLPVISPLDCSVQSEILTLPLYDLDEDVMDEMI